MTVELSVLVSQTIDAEILVLALISLMPMLSYDKSVRKNEYPCTEKEVVPNKVPGKVFPG
jgi:hypothetical protein